jgi:NADPH-dependent glutamate synthase beta subunit-like oxidoreductase/ferredoxin
VAVDGMVIESETEEVRQVRKTALELLLSDHVGDCLAPCHFACPAHMDVPVMLRQITAEQLREAIVTVKASIALPAVLGRVCPKPCEKGCRRAAADGAVAVCGLKRFVADVDLASGNPYLPECNPLTGKRVAIVGAGPTGLSAAYYLRREGHAVTLFDARPEAGGRLRHETAPEELPREVLDAEIATIVGLGIELRLSTTVGDGERLEKGTVPRTTQANLQETRPSAQGDSPLFETSPGDSVETNAEDALNPAEVTLDDLRRQFDAVLLACGNVAKDRVAAWGLKPAAHGILAEKETFATNLPGVFAAGNAIRAKGLIVRSVADGHEAAMAIGRYLAVGKAAGQPKPFSVRAGKMAGEELTRWIAMSSSAARQEPKEDATLLEAAAQSARCLHCDCRAVDTCKLRRYAAEYGADWDRFRGGRKPVEQLIEHDHVIFEPGKCICCGLCIQIASKAGEPLGLTFIGRGFDVRVGVPFNRSLDEALQKVAAQCVAACPTAAFALKQDKPASALPIVGRAPT